MTLKQIIRGLQKKLVVYKSISLFNPFFDAFIGGKRRPIWFDIDKVKPEFRQLETRFREIQAELDRLMLLQDKMPRYHEIDYDLLYASGRFNRDRRWNVFMLSCYGAKPEDNRVHCPVTCAEIEKIPGHVQAFFSILDAGKNIPRHTSPSRYYLRYHLPLRVPKLRPPTMHVMHTSHTWKEGESTLFDDSWEHEIVNTAESPRAVLIVDILRPMPLPAHILGKLICWAARWVYAAPLLKKLKNYPIASPMAPEPL